MKCKRFAGAQSALILLLSLLVSVPSTAQAQWDTIRVETGYPIPKYYTFNPPFVTMVDETIYVGTNNVGLWTSADGGTSWERTEVPSGVYDFVAREDDLFALQFNSGPYRSTDDGATWTLTNEGLPKDNWPSFPSMGAHDGSLFVGSSTGLYRSDDDGASWQAVNAAEVSGQPINLIESDGASLFVGAGGGLVRSTDGGESFSRVVDEAVDGISVTDGAIFAAGDSKVFVSTDGGETWDGYSDGFEEPYTRPFGIVHHDGHVFTVGIPVGRGSGDLYMADTATMTFVNQSGEHAGSFSSPLGVYGGYLYVNAKGGFWRRAVGDFGLTNTDVERQGTGVPGAYALHGNYPNPFNPQTTIRFDLPEDTPVTLTVYDALGRAVTTLVDETLATGHYQRVWSADNRSSGLYIYRLQTPRFTEHGTMLLVK